MAISDANLDELISRLESLHQEMRTLQQRVQQLESAAARREALDADQEFDDHTVLVIAAACAAFLGERPHIRQIRLLGGNSWMYQGRATIQSSHAIVKSK